MPEKFRPPAAAMTSCLDLTPPPQEDGDPNLQETSNPVGQSSAMGVLVQSQAPAVAPSPKPQQKVPSHFHSIFSF